ncbi:hypothetical protein MSG28_002642, partial [Choristoneura fumiferana]
DKIDLKNLYKETNKEIRKCYENHRLHILEKCIERTRSAKKAYKELDQSKKWVSSLQRGPTICKSRNDIINIATDFYTSLFSSIPDSNKSRKGCKPKVVTESLAKVLDVEPKRNGESDLSYGERLNEALRRFYVAHLDHVDWFGAQLKTKVLKFSYQAFTVLQTIE